MATASQRIEKAINMNVTSRWGSSLYQTTNYGLSGLVETHMDPWGYETGTKVPIDRMDLVSSGDYIATFMVWIERVPAGGTTGFIGQGYESVIKPTVGSAAFWINLNAAHDEDIRTMHGGCPVLKGSKWIVNKWINTFDQWRLWPCGLDKYDLLEPFRGMSK